LFGKDLKLKGRSSPGAPHGLKENSLAGEQRRSRWRYIAIASGRRRWYIVPLEEGGFGGGEKGNEFKNKRDYRKT